MATESETKPIDDSIYQPIIITYHKPLLQRAILEFWWRGMGGVWFMVILFLMVVWLGFSLAQGDTSWFVGLLSGFLIVAFMMMITVYTTHYRNTLGKFEAMECPNATLTISKLTFSFSSLRKELPILAV